VVAKLRICLLVNSDEKIRNWQYQALSELLKDDHTIELVLECRNTKKTRKSLGNLLYFLIALWTRLVIKELRNKDYSTLLPPNIPKVEFDALEQGSWQQIPLGIKSSWSNCDVMIKFGMGLLRDPDSLGLKYGVVSFHHGDPNEYRGRPAGFYEILNGERVCGVIVQELSNKLDGGKIKAGAYSKVIHDSYTKTLKNLYSSGVPLLRKALSRDPDLGIESSLKLGINYKLPKNYLVLIFGLRLFRKKVSKYFRMLFFRKNWVVAVSLKNEESIFDFNELSFVDYLVPEETKFIADAFWINREEFICEGLAKRQEQGQIYYFRNQEFFKIDLYLDGHMSYPMIFQHQHNIYILPEMSEISSQMVFELDLESLKVLNSIPLKGLRNIRLIDPTIFIQDGKYFLFGGLREEANNILRLFIADDLFGDFKEHPRSPIRIDPRGSRMGGPIVNFQNRKFRVGQDFSNKYGDGVIIFEIINLNSENYSESIYRRINFNDSSGPHTIDFNHEKVLIDRYKERFDPLKVVKFCYERVRFKIDKHVR